MVTSDSTSTCKLRFDLERKVEEVDRRYIFNLSDLPAGYQRLATRLELGLVNLQRCLEAERVNPTAVPQFLKYMQQPGGALDPTGTLQRHPELHELASRSFNRDDNLEDGEQAAIESRGIRQGLGQKVSIHFQDMIYDPQTTDLAPSFETRDDQLEAPLQQTYSFSERLQAADDMHPAPPANSQQSSPSDNVVSLDDNTALRRNYGSIESRQYRGLS